MTIHSNRENVQEVIEKIYAAYKLVEEKVAQPTLIYTEIH
ncbi:hypothetical protein V7157_28565 [Neobacillus drentensis]